MASNASQPLSPNGDDSQYSKYFSAHPAPESVNQHVSLVQAFIDLHSSTRRIVLVTSGGTIVPLEQKTVRFSKITSHVSFSRTITNL